MRNSMMTNFISKLFMHAIKTRQVAFFLDNRNHFNLTWTFKFRKKMLD